MAYGQRIETVEKTVSCRFRRSLPGAAGYDFWASNCESAGVEDEWIGRAFWAFVTGAVDQELLARIEYWPPKIAS